MRQIKLYAWQASEDIGIYSELNLNQDKATSRRQYR